MKDMKDFALGQVSEARKNKVEPSDDVVVQNGKIVDKDDAIRDAQKPNAAKKTKWAIDEPTSDDAAKYANKEDWTNNMLMIRARLRANKPFFILGHAGWGKTQIIKSIAKKFGRTIITVYLDKAVPEDLDGIPVPMEGKKGTVYQERAMPGWASYMIDNPDKKFLLFFDELNQADPRVMNALMPIVQENTIGGYYIPNYVVGAAGNYHDENDAVSDMSEPLMERFAPIIKWEDKTPEAWKQYIKHIHSVWDSKVGKELVDEFDKNKECFRSPRVIDQKMLEFLYEIKQAGPEEWDFYDPAFYLNYMQGKGILEDNLKRSEQDDIQKLAEYIDTWMHEDAAGKKEKENKRSREILEAPDWLKKDIENGMKAGWVYDDDNNRHLFSRDIMFDLFDPEVVTAEQIAQEVRKNEKKGIKMKYETAKEGMKDNPSLSVDAIDPKRRKELGI